jgi:5-oxoprolinase (ATP-hydrolysing) subunit A
LWWTISVPDEARTIDLNADVGEASDAAARATESALFALVTSVHVACGGHAGDEASMRAAVSAAMDAGVRVGAHPSYPDREGFGRHPMEMTPHDLSSALAGQVGDLVRVASSLGTTVHSVKAHGALYAEVGRGTWAWDAVVRVTLALCGPATWLVLPAGSPAVTRAKEAGLRILQEGFADRAYTSTGDLLSRQEPGSVYSDPWQAARQARDLVVEGTVKTQDGTTLSLSLDTLCIHGDSPDAAVMALAVHGALIAAGVAVQAPALHQS